MKQENWNIPQAINAVIGTISWQEKTIKKVATSKEANIYAVFWLIVTGIILVINTAIEIGANLSQYFVGPIMVILTITLSSLILHGIAKAFNGKGKWPMLARTIAFFSPISALSLTQVDSIYFSGLFSLYCFLTIIKLVSISEKISYPKALTVVIIPIVVIIITISIIILFLRETVLSGLNMGF